MFLRERNADIQSPLEMPFPTNWLESLSNLLKGMKKSEFQTVDALCAACAQDDIAAGMMLKRILHWHGSLQREFYLSNQDWWEQCRVRRKTIDRVKAQIFPMCGVLFETKFNRMAHANVTHYRLHEWKFMSRLSEVLGMPALYLFYRLCPQRAERYVPNGQNVVSKTDATLTRESTIKTSTEQVNDSVLPSKKIVDFKSRLPESTPGQLAVIELLKSAGVQGQRAVAYCTLPEDIVRACIASANEPGVRNRAGYLVGALKKQLQAHNTQPQFVQVQQSSNTLSESGDTATPPPNPLPVAGRGIAAAPAPEAVSKNLTAIIRDGMTAQAAWSATYHQLELQLDSQSFDSCLRAAKLVDYETDTSTFIVRVHSTYARDMLQHRLYRNVARVMRDVTGREVAVRFEAAAEKAAAQGLGRFLKMNTQHTQEGKSL
jgi:hypothetical protein